MNNQNKNIPLEILEKGFEIVNFTAKEPPKFHLENGKGVLKFLEKQQQQQQRLS